jgi:hypothetical protein
MAPAAAAAFEIESAESAETATALKRGPDYDDKMKTVTKKVSSVDRGDFPIR